jgi:hypothetical protein
MISNKNIRLTFFLLLLCMFLPACNQQAETKNKMPNKAPEFAYKKSEIKGEQLVLMRPPIQVWQPDTQLKNVVIYSAAEWERVWKQTSNLRNTLPTSDARNAEGIVEGPRGKLPPPGFDFGHTIILIAFQGGGNPSRLTEIVSATDTGDTIAVEVIYNTCVQGDARITMETNPADAVAIKKTDKKIVFTVTETNKCPGLIFKQNMTSG